jgi:RimJ/RimL family protein N-acetyltransferase
MSRGLAPFQVSTARRPVGRAGALVLARGSTTVGMVRKPAEPAAGREPRIARLTESDWELFANVRLRAISDSLGADDAQYRHEAGFTAGQWRRRLRDHAQFVALVGERPVGLIAAQQENTDSVYLYSLWLDPAARGHGLARPLVAAALDWARRQGVHRVTLRVAADNAVARSVYDSFGFTITVGAVAGARESEVAMWLSI